MVGVTTPPHSWSSLLRAEPRAPPHAFAAVPYVTSHAANARVYLPSERAVL